MNRTQLNQLLWELNKELRRKMRKAPYGYKVNMYIVGGASIIARYDYRESTVDVDAIWDVGSEMRESINRVAENNGLPNDWCNCNFKRTKSYTSKILTNSTLYKDFDRLRVWLVNPDLLLCMKLVAFRSAKIVDRQDAANMLIRLKSNNVLYSDILNLVSYYYGSTDVLSQEAKNFIREMLR